MRKRLLISILIALALPFPGPHIDSYIPLGWLPFRKDFWTADWFFLFALLGAPRNLLACNFHPMDSYQQNTKALILASCRLI